MAQAIAVEFQNITRIWEPSKNRALDSVSTSFEPGKIHAILGENGAGKSTLMKILFGLLKPSSGNVLINGKSVNFNSPTDAIHMGLGMVQQHFSLVETESVIDNIMLGHETTSQFGRLDRDAAINDLEAKLPSEDLRLDWRRKVGELSVGEQQRVEILKLIARNAEILVLDEPTAVLAPREIDSLFKVLKDMKAKGRTIFVITHKLSEVFKHCDTWMVLRGGRFAGRGNIQETSLAEIVKAMIGADAPVMSEHVASVADRSRPAISVVNLQAESAAVKLKSLNFSVYPGEILGVAGVDGSGQTELINSLIGLQEFSGKVEVLGQQVVAMGDEIASAAMLEKLRAQGLAIVSEDRHRQGLWMDQSVWVNANVGYRNEFWLNLGEWKSQAQRFVQEFDVRMPGLETEVRYLSGGNQQKLIFAREMLARGVKLLIAHQPTRGVDLAAISFIHKRIIAARAAGAAVLVVSSELDELFTLSDRIIVMSGGVISGDFERRGKEGFDRDKVGDAMILGRRSSN